MAYHGTRAAGVSTNPISIAVPGGARGPVVLDMATGVVARGKLVQARKTGRPIPAGWALDRDGNPTTDSGAEERFTAKTAVTVDPVEIPENTYGSAPPAR